MKQILLTVATVLFASSVFATVDSHDKVFLVVKHIQTEEFFIERAPIVGCYGLPQGPQLIQFTSEYKVTSNIGCGDQAYLENINYLTCAKVLSTKESDDSMGFSEITLDISKCEAKNDPEFVKTVQKAAKLNFPQEKGELTLNLVK